MIRYYLDLLENGVRLSCGDIRGYPALDEAIREARRRVNGAMPDASIRVYAHVATAFLAGNGDPTHEQHK